MLSIKSALRRMNFALLLGVIILLGLILTAVFAPQLAPADPMDQDLAGQMLPPAWQSGGSSEHVFGTDELGRDILSRLIWGARPAVLVMVSGAALSGLVGVMLGLLAGYFGGWIDGLISRLVETFNSFPPMLLAIVLAAVIGPGLQTVILSVALIGWVRFCRVVRGEILVMRELEYVTSARMIGVSHLRIILHELLPNLAPLLLVLFGLEMGRAVVVEAVLAFIGFSSSDIATWGAVIAGGRQYVYQAWWIMTLPIVVLVFTVLGLNAFGDGLRTATDPVLQQ
jgi:ABC-type dipeptide/oligopeptide/nickel transport system permease subunit